MWQPIVFILSTLVLYLYLKLILGGNSVRVKEDYVAAKQQFADLSREQEGLKRENAKLSKNCQDTIVLYDITKEICKTLDEDEVFTAFRELLSKYISVGDCHFLRQKEGLLKYPNYNVMPLRLDQHSIGYLVSDGIKGPDQEKFYILAQQFLLGIKRALLYKKVQEMAIRDSLTGVSSRRYLMQRFHEEIARSDKFNYKFSLLMIDTDHFKEYNDRYGHFVGDAILREVSQTIRESIRQIDLVGRYGGEEFMVILTETDREGAGFAAERIRQAIEAKRIKVYDEDFHITVSIGIALFPDDSRQAQPLIDKADQALYQAKQSGRNQVCIYGHK